MRNAVDYSPVIPHHSVDRFALLRLSVKGRKTAKPIKPNAMAFRKFANSFTRSLYAAKGSRMDCIAANYRPRIRGSIASRKPSPI